MRLLVWFSSVLALTAAALALNPSFRWGFRTFVATAQYEDDLVLAADYLRAAHMDDSVTLARLTTGPQPIEMAATMRSHAPTLLAAAASEDVQFSAGKLPDSDDLAVTVHTSVRTRDSSCYLRGETDDLMVTVALTPSGRRITYVGAMPC